MSASSWDLPFVSHLDLLLSSRLPTLQTSSTALQLGWLCVQGAPVPLTVLSNLTRGVRSSRHTVPLTGESGDGPLCEQQLDKSTRCAHPHQLAPGPCLGLRQRSRAAHVEHLLGGQGAEGVLHSGLAHYVVLGGCAGQGGAVRALLSRPVHQVQRLQETGEGVESGRSGAAC